MLGDLISKEIEKFVSEKPELFEKSKVKSGAAFVKLTSKTMLQLKTHKKPLQTQMIGPEGTSDIRKQFWEACQAISDLKKPEKKIEDLKTTACQEKLYNKNRWEFSMMTVNGQMAIWGRRVFPQPSPNKLLICTILEPTVLRKPLI